MTRLIFVFLLLTILQIAHTSCPDGFELAAGGQCNKYYGAMDLHWDQAAPNAIEKCKEMQAQPVIIHNIEQNSYWAGRWRSDTVLILGLVCNTTTTQWEWADGSAVDFKPKAGYDKALNGNCKSGCSWYLFSYNDPGFWFNSCSTGSYPMDIYCTEQIHPMLDKNVDGACEFFENDIEDGVCYQIGASAENWNDAQLSCQKLGANLASIHNLQENSFLRRMAVAKDVVDGLYLGATVAGNGGDFGWIDGTEWDYNNFAPGFPKTGLGDCIAMDTSTSSGQWVNIECSATLPVACIREHRAEPVCNSGPLKEGTLITSPGFPHSASTPCDYYLVADEGKRVEVEIMLLEANSCCDSLILYDGQAGGVVLANLTGEVRDTKYTTSALNVMRVSWQPKGGVGVMGMALTFRGV